MASDHTVDKGLEMNRIAEGFSGFSVVGFGSFSFCDEGDLVWDIFHRFLFCDKTLFPRLRLMDFETFHGAGKFVQINSCFDWKFCECRLLSY